MADKLNIQRFGEALARALTVQYEKEYPGLKITLTGIEKRTEDYPPGVIIARAVTPTASTQATRD